MTDDSPLTVPYPALRSKKVTAAFDGGRLSSDSGVMLLSLAERRRAPAHITHTVEDILKSRMLAIACGYADGNDFDSLRSDPAFKPCPRLRRRGWHAGGCPCARMPPETMGRGGETEAFGSNKET